ncbi:MAG TPA: hypothetical protein ENN06_12655 [Desulfobacteraceae bacterium]|nr:hypothetical protein [Desulfobacteraceae bacterium]
MGFDTERLKHRGRLAEKTAEAGRLSLLIHGQVRAVRELLDPFEDVECLQAEAAAAQAVELAGRHAEYLGLLAEIKAIKRALGD